MNSNQLQSKAKIIGLALLLIVFVSGCTNLRQGVAWPALSTVTYNGETKIALVYEGRIELLEPTNSQLVRLVDDLGDVRFDENGDPRQWIIEGNQFDNAQFYTNPTLSSDGGDATFVLPTYNDRILEFYVDTARVVNQAGISVSDGVIANIVQSDDFIYVPYRSRNLDALDRDTLDVVWTLETEGGIWAEPFLHEGVLYVTSMDHFLYALDAETGEPVWDAPADLEGAIASTPVLYDNHLYIGSYSHSVYKISLDGEIVASHEGQNWIWGTPVIFDDVLYHSDLSGNVYALNTDDLSEVWAVQPTTDGIRPAPLVTDDFVIVASRGGMLYWLSRDNGSITFEREVEGRPEILSDILLVEGEQIDTNDDGEIDAAFPSLIIIGTLDAGRLAIAFELENSSQYWVYKR